MNHEESEEIHNQLSKLENQFKEMGDTVLKKVDLSYVQELLKGGMHQKME
jgi:hypothetical protein